MNKQYIISGLVGLGGVFIALIIWGAYIDHQRITTIWNVMVQQSQQQQQQQSQQSAPSE